MMRTLTAFEVATYMGFRDSPESDSQYQVHIKVGNREYRVVQIGVDKAGQVFNLIVAD